MGTSIHRCGGVGAGQAMKALNNLCRAGGFLIGIEALLIGQRFGLDADAMVDVLNASTGMNNSTQKKFKQFVLSRRFDSGFGLDLMVKDLAIALEVARETAHAHALRGAVPGAVGGAAGALGPGQDHTAMAQLSEKLRRRARSGATEMTWEAYALRYGRHERPAQSNFLLPVADPHDAMPIDYFVWLLRGPDGREIVVDTGFDAELRGRRGRKLQPLRRRLPARHRHATRRRCGT